MVTSTNSYALFTRQTWGDLVVTLASYQSTHRGSDFNADITANTDSRGEEAVMWKPSTTPLSAPWKNSRPWMWLPASQAGALRNARHASAALAQRRAEREETEAFLARTRERLTA